jgi:hypothetical protein
MMAIVVMNDCKIKTILMFLILITLFIISLQFKYNLNNIQGLQININ